jgi:hypothetical protein
MKILLDVSGVGSPLLGAEDVALTGMLCRG